MSLRQLHDPDKRLADYPPGPPVPDWYKEKLRHPYRRDQGWGRQTQIEIDPSKPLGSVEGKQLVEARELARPFWFEYLIVRATPIVGDLQTLVFTMVQGVGSNAFVWRLDVPLIANQLRGSMLLSSAGTEVKPAVDSLFLNPLVLSKRRVMVSAWVAPFTQEDLG
jgi:hypothetical protein